MSAMDGTIEHVSRRRIDGVELQVIADAPEEIESLIEAEEKVARGFLRHGGWPCRRINMFVFESLQPLIDRLRRTALQPLAARELESKPMVHIYNMGDLTNCSLFVNRRLMMRRGVWSDPLALEGLLAHEHAHPLAENATTCAARGLKTRLVAAKTPSPMTPAPLAAVGRSLEHLAEELCIHAPHEVFTNEIAIRAGFGPALHHLNRLNLGGGRAGMTERLALAEGLRAQAAEGRLSQTDVELLLLTASMEAHVRMALETAAFVRAERPEEARSVEDLLEAEVFRHVEPEIRTLYRAFHLQCLQLAPSMDRDAFRRWAAAAFAPVIEEFVRRGPPMNVEFYY
jgi:hypothetical protein